MNLSNLTISRFLKMVNIIIVYVQSYTIQINPFSFVKMTLSKYNKFSLETEGICEIQ